jgi:hypothetical protein
MNLTLTLRKLLAAASSPLIDFSSPADFLSSVRASANQLNPGLSTLMGEKFFQD